MQLPATEQLLIAGGDERIIPDPVSGLTRYGCGNRPDPAVLAFGSSTASTISEAGFAAADTLRTQCQGLLREQAAPAVYARQTAQVRSALRDIFGLADQIDIVLAASGTDLHLLAGQWLSPDCVVMIAPTETGSGVPAALGGKHFCHRAAYQDQVTPGVGLGRLHARILALPARTRSGVCIAAAAFDQACVSHVTQAIAAGQSVLLVLTDVSKTGLLLPGVDTVLALQARWPDRLTVLVDACQCRLAASTVRDYLAHGFLVALTGSKFMSGPTFCGALLIPPELGQRYRAVQFAPEVGIYSCAADWPPDWSCGQALPTDSNFGLALRWQAALVGMRRFYALPEPQVTRFLQRFGAAVRDFIAAQPCFEAVEVAALTRGIIGAAGWDCEQTIFPFLLRTPAPLQRSQTFDLYQDLLKPAQDGQRMHLGQPVYCGERDGEPVNALRLCMSARLIVAACADGCADAIIADALAVLEAVRQRIGHLIDSRSTSAADN
ncbi:hypothetical protein RCH09_003117 [Actimicrobium sp. GrIS 1.19]|uniref:hypothetical protein n=1 Tax=Actimicrobium sp. GrIS 1.19 TaxID=3071708 RepID=UPI002E0CEB04|nr:hypothetical protein [Actimicrobium sp. GrIS 1.19]